MLKRLWSRQLGLLLTGILATGAILGVYAAGALDRWEGDAIDLGFQVRGERVPTDVAVVAVDDKTLTSARWRWPFPRSVHGRLVDRLHAAGVREIVYDVQFTERTKDKPWEDLALYDALGNAGGAVLATSETDRFGHSNVLGGDENLRRIHARAGAAALVSERGGVTRRIPLADGGLRSLSVAAAERLRVPVAMDAFGTHGAWIDFAGPPGTVPTYSFSDVLDGTVPARALKGKVVVVGASAPTLHDLHAVPTSDSRLMSGSEIQANAIHSALAGFPLRSAPGWVNVLTIVLAGMLPALLALFLRPLWVIAASIGAGVLYGFGTQIPFEHGLILIVVAPSCAVIFSAWWTAVTSVTFERAERRRVSRENQELAVRVVERTEELHEAQLEVVRRLAYAVESRDGETAAHVERMSTLCEQLALASGMGAEDAELVRHASALHDIGKLGIPDRILLKRGPMDADERFQMEDHARAGAAILSNSHSPLLQLGESIASTHHERWDGSGYPAGLVGSEIPLAGRIAAICDVFDALMTERPYKRAWSMDESLAEIERQAASQFDPALVPAFVALRPKLEAVYRLVEPGCAPGTLKASAASVGALTTS